MKIKEDLISILIPTMNSATRLKVCLESVINQSYKNLEIIICDGNSNDNTINIIEEYLKKDRRFKLIHSVVKNRSYQRNLLLDKCKGKFIFMMDSDDRIETKCIWQLHKLITHNKFDIVMPQIVLTDETDSIYGFYNNIKATHSLTINKNNVFKYLLKFNIIGCTKMYKKSYLKTARYDEELTFGEDVLFNLLLSLKQPYKFCYTNSAKYYYYRPQTIEADTKYINNGEAFLNKIYLMIKHDSYKNCKTDLKKLLEHYLHFFVVNYLKIWKLPPISYLKYRLYLLTKYSKLSFKNRILFSCPVICGCLYKLNKAFKKVIKP